MVAQGGEAEVAAAQLPAQITLDASEVVGSGGDMEGIDHHLGRLIRRQGHQELDKVGKDWTERIVFKGDFVYEKSRLVKATLDTYGWQIISQAPPSGVDRYEQGGYAKYVSGNKLSGDGKAISTSGIPYPDDWSPIVKDPSSWQSIFSNHVNPGGYGLDLDIQGNPFSYYVPGLESNTSIVKPYVDQLGGDRFFYSGWEANPLVSNLL